MEIGTIIVGLVMGFIFGYFWFQKRLEDEENNRKRLAGTYAEKFVPFLKDFKYESADTMFLGKPIDYIVFDGLSEGQMRKVVFVEVKSGGSKLSQRQSNIKEIVEKRKIEWKEIRM